MKSSSRVYPFCATLSVTVFFLTTVSWAAEDPEHLQGPNLIRNRGFEEAAQGGGWPAGWKREVRRDNREGQLRLDMTTAHSGRASLKWSNREPGYLAVATQRFSAEVKPGARYDLSAWIKTENVQLAKDRRDQWWIGPPIAMRCFDAQDQDQLVQFKPFFPLGMYCFIREDKMQGGDIRLLAEAKFNCLMQYGMPSREQMDLAQRYHVKVIYALNTLFVGDQYCPASIKTEADEEVYLRDKVRTFRDHPALLGWYTFDEPNLSMLPRLERHQRWVEKEDVDHPTWVVIANPYKIRRFVTCFDVVGADPYPIPFHPTSQAAEWTAESMRQLEGSRPLWMVPQAFSWRTVHPKDKTVRMPTPEEMRSMSWQCICEGATGIIFYEWWGLPRDPAVPFGVSWGGLKKIATEIDRMSPALLSVEPLPQVSAEKGPWLHWLARRHQGKLYVMAVNDGSGHQRGPAAIRSLHGSHFGI